MNTLLAQQTYGTPLDYVVILGYLVLILGFGSFFGRYTKTTRDFFFSGAKFSWWLIGMSMVATGVGSHSFMKYAQTGFQHGMSSGMSYMNDWFFIPLFMFGWLPIIYFARVRSIPEYFSRRFNTPARLVAVFIILEYMIGYIGYNLFTLGTAAHQVLGIDIWVAICAIALVSGVYITAGGQTAVIFTDLAQGFMLLGAGLLLLFIGLSSLGDGRMIGSYPGVYAQIVYDADGDDGPAPPELVVAGGFTTADKQLVNRIAAWNGQQWAPLGKGLGSDPQALALFDEDGEGPQPAALFAGGEFVRAGEVDAYHVARWDGSAWSALGRGLDGPVYAMTVFDEDGDGPGKPALYVAGMFKSERPAPPPPKTASATGSGAPANGESDEEPAVTEGYTVLRWDGAQWSLVGQFDASIRALAVYDEDGEGGDPARLFAGGKFTKAGETVVHGLARWDGSAWTSVAGGVTGGPFPRVFALTVWDNDDDGPNRPALYVGGEFATAGGLEPDAAVEANCVARWDGTAWSALGDGVRNEVLALSVFDPDGRGPTPPMLYAGGAFVGAGETRASRLARWDGSEWTVPGDGVSHTVHSLITFDADGAGPQAPALLVGGDFTQAGDLPVNSVARWDGSEWSSLQGLASGLGGGFVAGLRQMWRNFTLAERLPFAHFNEPQSFNFVGIFWQDGIAGSLMFLFVSQGVIMRFLAGKSVNEGRKAICFNTLFILPISMIVVGNAGWVGNAMIKVGLIDAPEQARDIFVRVSEVVCRPGVFGFILAALSAALMSTIDTLTNATAALFVYDIYQPYVARRRPDRHYMNTARVASASAALVGMGVGLFFATRGTDMYKIHGMFQAFVTPPIIAAVFLGAFWKRFTSAGAFAAMVGGIAGIWLSKAFPVLAQPFAHGVQPDPKDGYVYMTAAFGLVCSALIGVLVSLVTKPKSEAQLAGLWIGSIDWGRLRFKGSKPNDSWGKRVSGQVRVSDNGTTPTTTSLTFAAYEAGVQPASPTAATPVDPAQVPPDQEPPEYPIVRLSAEQMTQMKAEPGDLLYVSDARAWLGGLRSLHCRAGEPHREGDVVLLHQEAFDSSSLQLDRRVRVEKFF